MPFTPPAALKPGDTIGIVGITRWIAPDTLDQVKALWESNGYNVQIHENNYSHHHEWAGDFKERAAAFTQYWNDPKINAIIAARGGNRTLHLLDYIDFDALNDTPKIIMGASDLTALLNALSHKKNITTFHGPVASRYAGSGAQKHIDETRNLLEGQQSTFDLYGAKTLNEGTAEGDLVGGNMCIFNYLLGTEYLPSLKGKILFIEDESEEVRNIDRMFLHLKRLGQLDDIAGLMIGGFSDVKNTGSVPFPYTVEDLFKEYTKGLDIPVITNAPFGHGQHLMPLPIGTRARLDVHKNSASIKCLTPAVKLS